MRCLEGIGYRLYLDGIEAPERISLRLGVFFNLPHYMRQGYAVAQLVEALRYKPEGRGFDSRWCHWNFFAAL